MRTIFCTLMLLVCAATADGSKEELIFERQLQGSYGYLWKEYFSILELARLQKIQDAGGIVDKEKEEVWRLTPGGHNRSPIFWPSDWYELRRAIVEARSKEAEPSALLSWLQLKIEVQLDDIDSNRRHGYLTSLPVIGFGVIGLFQPWRMWR